ncbi:MAG: SGNH/GDSL hydrolase family protein [Cyclobacteriaceae bacterium]|nr:SGNH/GDSL hydrolase family protein [Cyclobacteriaceae bacterium]
MKKILSYLKSLSISVFVFLILLVITNWVVGIYLGKIGGEKRHLLPGYAEDHAYAEAIFNDYHSTAHRYKSFAEWQMLPYEGKTLHINNEGLRFHTPPPGATESPVIRFFGGSTMWGEGSDDAHTIPALVHQKINTGTVINHAQLAYNSRQNLEALISLYAKGEKADVVIFYDGVNDAAFLCPQEIQELPGHRLIPLFQKKIYGGGKQLILTVLNNLFTKNILLLVQYRQNTGDKKPSLYDCLNTDKGLSVARMLMANWEMAHELVSSRGGKFIAVLQPVSYIGSPQVAHLQLHEELGANFRFVYTELQKLISEKNHPWIYDFTSAFDSEEYIYIDFCHVTKSGNKIIADKLTPLVLLELNPAE